MTVSTTSARVAYSGDGSTTVFSVPFYFFANSDLAVYSTTGGVTTELVLTTHYTVAGAGVEAGGAITMLSAPASGVTLTIIREPVQTQTTDYQANDPFPAETHEAALDKLTMITQHLQDQINRSLLLDVTQASATFPAPLANRLIGWNGDATALENKTATTAIATDPISGAVTQSAGGTGAITLGGGEVTAANATNARTLAAKLGDFLTSDDEPVLTLASVAYAQRALIKVAAGETVKLVCDPTTDDFVDMCAWRAAGHIVEEGGDFYIEISDALHEVSDFCPIKHGTVDIRGTATPTQTEVTAVAYTSLGSDLYRATVTVADALPARVVVGWGIGMTPIVADGITHPCSGGHEVLTIAGDRLSFTFNFRSHGRVATDATNTTTMTAGTTLGITNNRVLVPFHTIKLTGGWVGASDEGFFRVEQDGHLKTSFVSFVYDGTTDTDREMIYTTNGGKWSNLDYSVFVGCPKRVFRAGQGGYAYVNRAYIGNADGEECTQILSAGVTFIRSILSGGSVAGVTFGASCSAQSTSSMVVGSPIGLRTTGAGALIRWDTSYVGWCDDGARPTAGEISFNSSACIIERCTDALDFGSSAFPKYITGDPTIQNCTNTTITRGVLINGGRWIDSATPWTPSVIYDATVAAVDFPALGTARAWTTPTTINSVSTATVSVPGALTTDIADLRRISAAPPDGVAFMAVITAADTVTLYACDFGAANTNITAINMLLTVTRCR